MNNQKIIFWVGLISAVVGWYLLVEQFLIHVQPHIPITFAAPK